jgi:catechol 2,3-dioxygenase-like lactoylglutathione lyase family enzyme
MRVIALHHIQLAMPPGGDAQARVFYEGVLGISEAPKPPNLALRGGVWFENDLVKIHLGIEADFRPARKAHPALQVEDLPALQQALAAAGYPVNGGEQIEGYRRIYTEDPFGNRIELMESEPRPAGVPSALRRAGVA